MQEPSTTKNSLLYNPVMDYIMDNPVLLFTVAFTEGFIIGLGVAFIKDK